MNTNLLKYQITIQQPVEVRGASGVVKQEFQDYLTSIWASVKYLSGSKILSNNEIFASQSILFTIRYRTTITDKMRIIFNGSNYKIESISELGYKDGMEILASKI